MIEDHNDDRPDPSQEGMTAAIQFTGIGPRDLSGSVQRDSTTPPHAWVLRIMEQEGPGILRLLYRFLGREADVLDAYQDCFCKLAARGNPCELQNAKAYAYRTASNIAVELLRTRRRQQAHQSMLAERQGKKPVLDPDRSDAESEKAKLREAVAKLPMHLRNVVILRDLCSLAYEEVGRILRIDAATARVYRRHAIVRLSGFLGQETTE